MSQQHQLHSKPTTSSNWPMDTKAQSSPTTSRDQTGQSANFISLSKLKNYMPENLGPISHNDRVIQSTSDVQSYHPQSATNKPQLDEQSSNWRNSLHLSQHRIFLARANQISSSSALDTKSSHKSIHNIEPSQQESLSAATPSTDQQNLTQTFDQVGFGSAQRESKEQKKSATTVAGTSRSVLAAPLSRSLQKRKGEESCETARRRKKLDQSPSLANREERKRKEGIDQSQIVGSSSKSNLREAASAQHTSGFEIGSVRNNMTPSSSVIRQDLNYVEKRHDQQVHNISTSYATNSDEKVDIRATSNQGEAIFFEGRGNCHATNKTLQQNDICQLDAYSRAFDSSSLDTRQPSSSSVAASSNLHILDGSSQFKSSDNVGSNPITNNRETTLSVNIGKHVEFTKQNVSQISSARPARILNIDNSVQIYPNYISVVEASPNIVERQHFVQYNSSSDRLAGSYHSSSFPTSMLASHQVKLDNVATNQRYLNQSNTILNDTKIPNCLVSRNIARPENTNVDHLMIARGITDQYRERSFDINQNHNYNLMTSSKSSSPKSTTSTPSPKATAMQTLSASHSANQLISAGLNHSASAAMVAAESHLDHINQHYISNNTSNVGMNHSHQQVNHQHYAYNTQSIGTASNYQHHLNVSNLDQSGYNHIQNQHQQQHQQQHHHTHQQASNPSQQSIYHQIGNNTAHAGNNHSYANANNNVHYHSQLQTNNNQGNNLMSDAHQSHLNNAAAACAAAAVVSQTLKTVANQHNHHQHHYGGSITNGFETNPGLMNNKSQQHQQFPGVNTLGQQHLVQGQGFGTHPNQQHHQQSHQQAQNVPVHQASSIVSRKYQCKMCPQVFMSKAEMKYHNQNHLREAKPYKCLRCPKAFANSSYLSQHMRIHQGLKPYTCDICTRKFTQLSHLQQHKRTHTGDKPYKCNYMNCTKQFSQLSNLQSHSRCHQLDKPYKCNSCYKCFHDEQSLIQHIPRHLESKHLKRNLCIFCGSSYQQERGLVKHFQQYHTDKTPTLVAAAVAAGTTGNTNLIASLVSTTQPKFATPSSGSASSNSSSSSSASSSSSLGSVGSNSNVHLGNSGKNSGHNNNINNDSNINNASNLNAAHGNHADGYQVGTGFI